MSKTEYDSTVPGTETDWLANSVYGYGYGYTKEQALAAMAAEVSSVDKDSPIRVNFIEHVGAVAAGPGTVDVKGTFVRQHVVEIDPDVFNELRDHAIDAKVISERAVETAETLDRFEPGEDN